MSERQSAISDQRSETSLPAKVGMWLLLLALVLAACGGGDEAAVNELTVKLTEEALQETAGGAGSGETEAGGSQADSAGAGQEGGEETGLETAVETAAPDEALVAAGATATARFHELEATRAAADAAAATADAATATALAPIHEELVTYGVDPSQGRLAWVHPPLTMEVTDFEDYEYGNIFLLTPARDFVLTADVTWSSAYAESGCGFTVRSDGEEENINQYLIGLTRGAQGHVLFGEQVEGEVALDEVTDIYANGIDPLFQWQNETTNRIAIVARGQEFTLYSNGTRLGKITAKAGFDEGFVAFVALNRSGGIRCDFNDAWLWKMNS